MTSLVCALSIFFWFCQLHPKQFFAYYDENIEAIVSSALGRFKAQEQSG
jgi:hypothetical protein